MKRKLIGESGGSKTDWCLIEGGSVLGRFETESLHPMNLSSELAFRLEVELSKRIGNFDEISVQLYCAGCVRQEKKDIVTTYFHEIGIKNIQVNSDLDAAGIAIMSTTSDWIAIMGTGSVLFRYENQEVKEIIGGKGHLLGDEGSGYYFGRLLLEALMNDELSDQQLGILSQVCDVKALLQDLNRGTGKFRIAQLSSQLGDYNEQFDAFHSLNFELFIEKHLDGKDIKAISVVGGYAFHHQEQLLKILDVKGIKLKRLINRPMDLLIERSVSSGN